METEGVTMINWLLCPWLRTLEWEDIYRSSEEVWASNVPETRSGSTGSQGFGYVTQENLTVEWRSVRTIVGNELKWNNVPLCMPTPTIPFEHIYIITISSLVTSPLRSTTFNNSLYYLNLRHNFISRSIYTTLGRVKFHTTIIRIMDQASVL
jgi:hypothetical protein